eukprot:SRR837773.23200.p1 GENE.SRR837773.23200~~SRR837773.23200.p1  ORF type:complete len:301 (+),score=92.00 SRR837773.23200:117-905(+)
MSASDACCSCGGGKQVALSLAAQGTGSCSDGAAISDAGACRAAAAAMEIQFHLHSEHAPQGHAHGCYTDSARSHVWFNADESAVNDGTFSLVCMGESSVVRRHDDGDDADDEDDDDDDDDTKDAAEDEAPKTHDDGTLTKNGIARAYLVLREAVSRTHDALARSMRQRAAVGRELRSLGEAATNPREVDEGVQSVLKETKSGAMAGLLGDMWKEMRMFSTPFYEEKLLEQQESLKRHEPELQAAYDRARAELVAFKKDHHLK